MISKVIKYLKVIKGSLKIPLKIIFIYLINSRKDQCAKIANRNLGLSPSIINDQMHMECKHRKNKFKLIKIKLFMMKRR